MQIIFESLGELQNFITEMGWTRPESEQAQSARRRRAGSETAKADTNAGQREAVAPSPASPAPAPAPVAQPVQPAPVAQQAPAPAPAASVGEITDDQLRQAVLNLGHGSGIATAKAILQEFGIKRAPECPPERRGELLARLQAAKA